MNQNTLELARQGDLRAIALLMNKSLNPKGIYVKVNHKDSNLQVLLESEQSVNQQALVGAITQGITGLEIHSIQSITIYARLKGYTEPDWTQKVDINRKRSQSSASQTMKGRVLAFSIQQGNGVISGDDGKRYKFLASSWNSDRNPVQGMRADFEVSPHGEALAIYLDLSTTASNELEKKSRTTAVILAFFLGAFGAHKFYLGNQQTAIIMLLSSLIGIFFYLLPTIVMSTIAFVEFIIYVTKTDEEFHEIYVSHKKAWF